MTPMFVTFIVAGRLYENYLLRVKKSNFTDAAMRTEIAVVTGYGEEDVTIVHFERAKKVGRRYVI